MRTGLSGVVLFGVWNLIAMPGNLAAQAHKHEEPKAQQDVAPGKSGASAKESGMACCEKMEKMGEAKGTMPMKSEMKAEMKAKMSEMGDMKAMKEKMMERMHAPQGSAPKAEGKAEGSTPPAKDAHQH